MNHFHNILVGIDLGTGVQSLSGALSAANAEALERGLAVAESCQAQLCFVSVLDAHDMGAVGRHVLTLGITFSNTLDLQLFVVHAVEQLPLGDPTGFGITPSEARELHRSMLAVKPDEFECPIHPE